MTAISASTQTNILTPSSQNSVSTSAPSLTNKISKFAEKLYLGPGYTNVPGVTNLLFAPIELYDGIKAAIRAHRIGDEEGIFENVLRVVQAPINIGNSLMQAGWYVMSAGALLKIIHEQVLNRAAPLSKIIIGVGFILCAIEGVLESVGLIRTINFYKKTHPSEIERLNEAIAIQDPAKRQLKINDCIKDISKLPLPAELKTRIDTLLKNKNLSSSDFTEISSSLSREIQENIYLSKLTELKNSYFQISTKEAKEIDAYVREKLPNATADVVEAKKNKIIEANLETKKNQLIRRVHPWLANEIESSLPELIRDLQSTQPDKKRESAAKAAALFENIKIQSQKKLLIHTLGLIAILFTVAGLIAGSIACPFLIPFALLSIGTFFSFARYYMHAGLMDSKGWDFSVSNCIPNIVKKIYRKVFTQEKAPETAIVPTPITIHYTLPNSIYDRNRKEFEKTLSGMNFSMTKA